MVRLGHRWSPAGDTNWDGNTVERTSWWQQSLLDCHVSRPRKTTPNDPNAALWEQRAPSHCPQHHPPAVTVTGQGQGYRAVDWLLHQLPVCPVCPAEQCPRERAQGPGSNPLHRKRTEQHLIHGKPQEAHFCLTMEKGDKRDIQKMVLMLLSFSIHSGWVTPF